MKVYNADMQYPGIKLILNPQHTYTESAVPSPPKMGKTPAKPGNRHTATMWSNPLNTVVKKANKSITSPKNNTRPLGNMNTNRTKMSWKSGFIED